MKKSTKEYILTKPLTEGANGHFYLETITIRVGKEPSDIVEAPCAKTFRKTCFKACMESATEMGCKITLGLNRLSILQDDLNSEECLHVINSLNSNISMINERILDVLLPEADYQSEHEEEFKVVADKVRQLLLKNQQTTKEVTELIQSITPKIEHDNRSPVIECIV